MKYMVRMVVRVIVESDIFTFTKKMGFGRNLPTRKSWSLAYMFRSMWLMMNITKAHYFRFIMIAEEY